MAYKLPKSRETARNQYDAIQRAYRRTYAGSGQYGFDMADFYSNAPDAYRHVKAIQASYATLPERTAR